MNSDKIKTNISGGVQQFIGIDFWKFSITLWNEYQTYIKTWDFVTTISMCLLNLENENVYYIILNNGTI